MTTRRHFLGRSATIGAGTLFLAGEQAFQTLPYAFASVQVPQTPLLGTSIPQYVDPVPTFVGQRVADPFIVARTQEFQQKILPESIYAKLKSPFQAGTYLWGYKIDHRPVFYPGFTVVAHRHCPTTITYVNDLPYPAHSRLEPLLTIDQTVHWADPLMQMGSFDPYKGPIPTVTHLHGGEVPSAFDGGPSQWFTRNGIHGKGYATLEPLSANSAVYRYPNTQEATTLLFHDHTLGATRLTVFAGLITVYFIRDQYDTGLPNNPLRLPSGQQEVELLIQDRQFDTNGQLLFPDGHPCGLNGCPPNPDVHPYWIPEFFGDVIVVNGKSWPYLNVEPRRYRLRFLNGANARFFSTYLVNATTSGGQTPVFWQIGTDGGLLDQPVQLSNSPNNPNNGLFLAPGERADTIIDFTNFAGQTFTLRNDAPAPYPDGQPGTLDPATTGQVMQFRVNLPLSSPDTSYNPASGEPLRGGKCQERPIVRLANPQTGTLAVGVKPSVTRQLVLIEADGPGGPLEVLLNNTKWNGKREGTNIPVPGSQPSTMGQGYYLTELPEVGSTEVWEVINLTPDAHPIHIHLIQFQLLNRQNFDATTYRTEYDSLFPGGVYIRGYGSPLLYTKPNAAGALGGNPDVDPYLQGGVMPPDANEAGWKDTVKMFPNQVTRIVARWAPQDVPINAVKPGQNLYPFDPTVGPGYVWHCHIIDHEDNEMMRPYSPVCRCQKDNY
jgi:spore coat protein A, manganese oxidase